jgi:hypothetical protein
MLRKQLAIIGSWTFSTAVQADYARFVAAQNIAVDRLFTHRWRLDQAEQAYAVFDRQTAGKGVFVMAGWLRFVGRFGRCRLRSITSKPVSAPPAFDTFPVPASRLDCGRAIPCEMTLR